MDDTRSMLVGTLLGAGKITPMREAAARPAVRAGPSGRWAFDFLRGLREHRRDTEAIILAEEDLPWDRVDTATPRPFAYYPRFEDPDWLVAAGEWAHELHYLRRENRFLAARARRYELELEARTEEVAHHLAEIRQLAEANRSLRTLATHDELTGLRNYRYFAERLREEVERVRRYGSSFGLAVLDIDHFKEFNDTYGHVTGNHALAHVAAHLKQHLRAGDVAARIGGEEFAELLLNCDRSQLGLVCERVRHDIEVGTCSGLSERSRTGVTVSIGAAMCPDDGEDPSMLLERADQALYAAKLLGRNRVARWETVLGGDARSPGGDMGAPAGSPDSAPRHWGDQTP